jgi:hypothetical protein
MVLRVEKLLGDLLATVDSQVKRLRDTQVRPFTARLAMI